MGDYTIERFLIAVFVFVLILLAMVFTKKRKVFIGLTVVVLVGYLIFFFVRGQLIENQYQRSIEIVNEYLENQYSDGRQRIPPKGPAAEPEKHRKSIGRRPPHHKQDKRSCNNGKPSRQIAPYCQGGYHS